MANAAGERVEAHNAPTERLAELPPPAWPPPAPTPPHAPASPSGGRNRGLIAAIVAAAITLGVGGGALAVVLLGKEDEEPVVATVTEATEPTAADASAAPPAEAPSRNTGTPASSPFTTYVPTEQDYYYLAELPAGPDWSKPTESHPTSGALLRTTVRGPAGTLLLVDRTPYDVPQLGGGYESSRTTQHPEFGQVTEYVFRDSETIPECVFTVCVDYLVNDGAGGGWGVLAGGPDLASAEQVAERVMRSLSLSDY
jgi:hypothetical protein